MATMMRLKTDQTAKRYEKIVLDYFNEGGLLLVCSDDEAFVKALRFTISQLKLDIRNFCREVVEYDDLVTLAGKLAGKSAVPLIVFLERRMRKASCIKAVKVLKGFYADKTRIIVVSSETSRAEIVLAHEVGADSFVTKPISANAIIEKAAFAIRPNTQLGILMDRCATLLESGELADAETLARRIFEIKPDSLKGHLLMGDLEVRRGNHKEAETHYLKAYKSEKLYIEPLKKLVDLSVQTGNTDKKLFFLNKLDALSPLNFERKVEIGETYLSRDESDKAREYFEQAKKVVSKVAADMVSESLMEIARKIGEKDEELALAYMTEAIEAKGGDLTRDDLWMFNNRGIVLRRQGKWREAVDNYDKALALAPGDAGLYYNIGVAYADGRAYDKAWESFQKALQADEAIVLQAPSVGYNIAMALHRIRRPVEARKYLGMALELDPGYEPAKKLLESLS
ncbi:MAG: tetratricopeptide repeat protein [Desulfovibrionaceae bacterium]|nr:tetratricopeptide repeat protein [Desulfovibrionaceae bacterium]